MPSQQPEWTFETLLLHIKTIIEGNDKRYAERFEAMDEAVKKAEAAAEKRFESVNEFRSTLSDQQHTLLPRAEYEKVNQLLTVKVDRLAADLRDYLSTNMGSSKGFASGWGYAIALIGVITGILIALFTKH